MGNPDLSRQQMAASLPGPGGGTGIQAGGEAAAPRAQRHGARLLRGTQRRGTCGAAPPALPGPACRPGSPRLFSTSFPPVRGSEVVSPRLPPWQQQGDSHLPPTAIPRLPYTCPHEGASAPGQCWPPPVCVSRCHGLSYTTPRPQQQLSLVTRHTGRCHCAPWGWWCSAPKEDNPTLRLQPPLPQRRGRQMSQRKKCALGLRK